MAGIHAVNQNPMSQVHAPRQAAQAKHADTVRPSAGQGGQGGQEDSLTISSEALQALEDAAGGLEKLHHHHHKSQQESVEVLLTYPNIQSYGSNPGAVQAQHGGTGHSEAHGETPKVAGMGSSGSAGAAKA